MAGVDHLIAQGIADPDRLGVMGASYGGFMTNWIVTQTDRFKAASSGASISDLDGPVLPARWRRPHGRVLQASVGEPRLLRRAFADHIRRAREHADSASSTANAIRACRSRPRKSSTER